MTFQRQARGMPGRPGGAIVALFGALCLCVPAAAGAQPETGPAEAAQGQGAFPGASFEASFRKYTPPQNVFSPFYSWDANLAFSLTAFRKGASALEFAGTLQTVGTESLGPKVSVGGTGYIMRFGYVRSFPGGLTLSAGIAHLSSHLTRDLDDKTEEQREKGAVIPDVADPSEYNVFYLKGRLRLSRWPFTPELEFIVEPINFRFDGCRGPYVRPLFLGTRSTLWRGGDKAIAFETEHEVGYNSFNHFTLLLELYARDQPEGRFQVFLSGSPGGTLHVSPNVGGLRDGIAIGIRMRFRTPGH